MPRRFLITYDAPMAIRSQFMAAITPDAALVQLPSLPISPAQQQLSASDPSPSVGQMLISKFKQHSFEYQKRMTQFLSSNPEIVEGIKHLYNNIQIPGSTHMKFFELENAYIQRNFTDPRLLSMSTKYSFEEAVSLLFLQGKSTCGIVNAVFGVDIACPLHKNIEVYQRHQKQSCIARDGFRLQNFASPDNLISPKKMNQINDLIPNSQYDALSFRLTFLQQQVNENLLSEEICRYYSLSELVQCNVSLDDLIDEQHKQQVQKLLKPGKKSQNSVRIIENTIQKQEINQKLSKENIVVLSVVLQDRPEDNVIQQPCDVQEFLDYNFDKDSDPYVVTVTFNLQNLKMIVDKQQHKSQRQFDGNEFSDSLSDFGRSSSENTALISVSQSQTIEKERKEKQSLLLSFINHEFPKLNQYLKQNMVHDLQDSGIIVKEPNFERFEEFQIQFLKSQNYDFPDVVKNEVVNINQLYPNVVEVQKSLYQYISEMIGSVFSMFEEQTKLSDKTTKKDIMILQAAISNIFGYRSLSNCLFSSQFSLPNLVETLLQLQTGIQNTLLHRFHIPSIFFTETQKGFSVPMSYSIWAFDFVASSKYLFNQHSFDTVCNDIYFQFHNNPSAQHSLTKNLLRSAQLSDLEFIKHENQEAVFDDFDKLSSVYFYNLNQPESDTSLFSLSQTDLLYNPQQFIVQQKLDDLTELETDYNIRLAKVESMMCDGNFSDEEIREELNKLANSQYLVQTQQQQFYIPTETQISKQILDNEDVFISIDNIKMLKQDTLFDEKDENITIPCQQDTINIYHILMLEPPNQEVYNYCFETLNITIPKTIVQSLLEGTKKQPKTIYDLIQFAGAEKLVELGFDLDYLSILVDLSKHIKLLMPALIYDQNLGYYYMPAVLENNDCTLSSLFNADLIRQAHMLQQQLIEQIAIPSSVAHATILSLLQYSLVNRKFIQALKDHIASNFSCFMFMGMIVAQHIAEMQFESLLRFLLSGNDSNTIHLTNIPDSEHYQQLQSEIQHLQRQAEFKSIQLYPQNIIEFEIFDILDFTLSNESELKSYLNSQPLCIQNDMFNQLSDSMLNLLPLTRLADQNGQIDRYSQNLPLLDQLALSTDESMVVLNYNDLVFNSCFVSKTVNWHNGITASQSDNLLIGRNRGLLITFLIIKELLSPDNEMVQTQKGFGFVSIKSSYAIYLTLLNYYKQQEIKVSRFRFYVDDSNRASLLQDYQEYICNQKMSLDTNQSSLLIPSWLHSMVNSQYSLQELFGSKIFAPVFQKYTILERIGKLPIIDIFGRELRHSVDFQPLFRNITSNDPAALDKEAPPQPSAAGEESSVQGIIDFWMNIHNKYFCISQDRISAISSPLYVLEEREIELLKSISSVITSQVNSENQQQNELLSCKCTEFNAIIHPNTVGFQLEQYQRGMLYMSPYFIPVSSEGTEINRMKDFVETARQAITQISQIIRDGLNKYCKLPIAYGQFRSLSEQIIESIKLYFTQMVPTNGKFEHLKEILNDEESWLMNKAALSSKYSEHQLQKMYDSEYQIQTVDFLTVHNCNLLSQIKSKIQSTQPGTLTQLDIQKSIETWVENIQNAVKKQLEGDFQIPPETFQRMVLQKCMEDIIPLIRKVLQAHPILDVIKYGDPFDQSVSVPTDVCVFLKSGKLGKVPEDEKKLCLQIINKKPIINEVLIELKKNQNELLVLEKKNLERNIVIQQRLIHEQYFDIHNETTELFNTLVTSAWAKSISGNKANNGQKISNDILALGGFDTTGFPVLNDTVQQLTDLAVKNAIYECDDWDKDGFSIEDIVDF